MGQHMGGLAIATHARKERYRKRNPTHTRITQRIRDAVKSGALTKPCNCEECKSEEALSGHHDDYANPLNVRWLCNKCHRAWHRINGRAQNYPIDEEG